METIDKKVTLLISSCQKFSDLWDANIHFLNQYWPNKPQNTIIVTDEKTAKAYTDIKIVSVGSGVDMPLRILEAIGNIDTEYVLLSLDDYFLTSQINNSDILKLVEFADKEQIDYIRLFPLPKEKKKVDGEDGLYWIDLNNDYAVNLYPGLWKRDFLMAVICSDSSIWDFEVSLTKKASQYSARCVMSRRNEFCILDVVRKGKVLHKANRELKKAGISIGERPIVSYKTELRYLIVGVGKKLVPQRYYSYVKRFLSLFGMSFYSDGK